MHEHPSRLRQVLAELRRRRVFRVAVVYGGVAFVIVQAADLVFPALNLPGWTYSFLVALALLGFPLAVALAWAFDITPGGVRRTTPATTPPGQAGDGSGRRAGRRAGGRVPPVAWFAAGIAVVLSGGWLLVARGTGPEPTPLDSGLVAVLPFRTTGLDPGLAYLGEGMVDLLAAKLTGTGGPRAIDPQTTLSAARRAGGMDVRPRESAIQLARELGAGGVVTGSVVGTPAALTVTATFFDSRGVERATTTVDGPPEALAAMVDQLTAALLSLSAGEAEQSLPSLTSTSLPALRAYLEGQAAVRSGQFAEAGRHFSRALDQDSTFVLAALAKAMAIQWLNDPDTFDALQLAWERRDRLSARDRILLEAYAGPDFPAVSPLADWIEAAERAARAVPDRAEAWYWIADRLYHQGDWVGRPGGQQDALEFFQRAVALDPSFLPPVIHLVEIAAATGDTAALRTYSEIHFALDTTSEEATASRWVVATSTGDSTALRELRSRIRELPTRGLWLALIRSQAPGGPLEDADLIAAELRRRPLSRAEQASVLGVLARYELARGRPSMAAAAVDEQHELLGDDPGPAHIANALFWDGDVAAAGRAVRSLEDRVAQHPPDVAAAVRHAGDLCVLGQWRLWRGEEESGEDVARQLDAVLARIRSGEEGDPAPVPSILGFSTTPLVYLDTCARVLGALVLVQQGRPGARAAVDQLEASFRRGQMDAGFLLERSLILAQLWESLGDTERALAATRLRMNAYSNRFPTDIAREARLAEALGDRDTAIRLSDHYLRLRSDPEPVLVPAAERARARLARLAAETR
jgi:tetratricopeptide (TPR) repeat protein/TolB-like protein